MANVYSPEGTDGIRNQPFSARIPAGTPFSVTCFSFLAWMGTSMSAVVFPGIVNDRVYPDSLWLQATCTVPRIVGTCTRAHFRDPIWGRIRNVFHPGVSGSTPMSFPGIALAGTVPQPWF